MTPSRALLDTKLRQYFPDPDEAAAALAVLDLYLSRDESGRARVQLAILKLGGRDLERLRHFAEVARADYRDVLAWAEYPEQMRTGISRYGSPAEVYEQIAARDRDQYLRWLESDTPEPIAAPRNADEPGRD